MKKCASALVSFLCVCASFCSFAQIDPTLSLYRTNYLYYNPAYAADSGKATATLTGRRPYLSAPGQGLLHSAYNTVATFQKPLERISSGIGIIGALDRTGDRISSISAAYQVRLQLGQRKVLQLGVQAGRTRITFYRHYADAFPEISVFDTTITRWTYGAGAWLSGGSFYAGLSTTRSYGLIWYDDVWTSELFYSYNNVYFTAGQRIHINSRWTCTPSVLLHAEVSKTEFGQGLAAAINSLHLLSSFNYGDRFELGIGGRIGGGWDPGNSWRLSGSALSLLVMAGVRVQERIKLQMAADLTGRPEFNYTRGPALEAAVQVAF